ncbi:RNA recognition motif domain-containing protein [Dyadobacter aurulentus]|uniref:RNA recognition motif domain-containing protein n=1 Tax=Dyadobacter sp. UC 10 TaxID=2605428 RepID=UPI0011F0FEB7|nr:RNA-binding protein [Dyadobacter sp. UC 10]KAA0991418.1 RNA-binding protein [Dyadobacter sp. UC 10]
MDIFVGSLSFKLKESELREAFEKYGNVSSAKIIIDKITRQSKGFGFVEMPDESEARLAISSLNGAEMYGRPLVVNESQKKEQRPGESGPGSRTDSGREGFNRPRPNDTDNRSAGRNDNMDGGPAKSSSGTGFGGAGSFGGGGFGGGSSSGGGDRYRSQDRKPGGGNDRPYGDRGGQGNKSKTDSRYGRGNEFNKKGGGGSKRHFSDRDDDDRW